MKRLLALLVAAAVSPAQAFAAELGETPVSAQGPIQSAAPVLQNPLLPSALPVVPEALASGTPLALPQAVVPPAPAATAQPPVTAQAALTQTAAALDGKSDAQALTRRFDGSAKLGAGLTAAGLVLAATPAAPVLSLSPAIPAAYSAWRLSKTPRETRWKSPDRSRDWGDYAENALHVAGAAFAAGILMAFTNGIAGPGVPLALAGALGALLIGQGGASVVASTRGQQIQRWQASHDQKYRVDPGTGRLKDVRGHKYGQFSDKYVELVPGQVSGLELAALRLLGVGAALALAWALGAPASTLLLINVLATAGFFAADLKPKPDYAPAQSEPDR